MVTTYGTSSRPVRLGDSATPGAGTYEIYLAPEKIVDNWGFVPAATLDSGSDASIVTLTGALAWDIHLQGVNHAVASPDTPFDNLKKALRYWGSEDTALYYTSNNSAGANIATWPNAAYTLTQIRVKIVKVVIVEQAGALVLSFMLKRVTY